MRAVPGKLSFVSRTAVVVPVKVGVSVRVGVRVKVGVRVAG